MAEHLIELRNVCKKYGDVQVLDNFNLTVKKNEFVTLLGPSGCGKTTTLRLIAGFEEMESGELLLNGKNIAKVPAYERPFNTVFQRYALFENMNIYDNIAFGLKINKVPKDEIDKRVKDVLHLVNLDGYEKRPTTALSGGQMQRVAMARAIVNRPQVLLLDEPLAALDLKMRQDMQLELKNMQRKLGITFVYVTHDQEEALAMSDTVVVMNKGVILQKGRPEDIYNEPSCAFVADFIGESNIVAGTMIHDELVNFGGHDFKCVDKGFGENTPVSVVVRPEDITLIPAENTHITGIVESVVFYGVHYEMMVRTESFVWLVQSIHIAKVGDRVGLQILPDAIHIMPYEDDLEQYQESGVLTGDEK